MVVLTHHQFRGADSPQNIALTPSTFRDFKKKFPNYSDFTFKLIKKLPPSDRGLSHLLAYRVLLVPDCNQLPGLHPYHEIAKSEHEESPLWKLLGRLSGVRVVALGRPSLTWRVPELASFHHALADLLVAVDLLLRQYPHRNRKQTECPLYQTGEGLRLSSPSRGSSRSQASDYKQQEGAQTHFNSDLDAAKGEDVVCSARWVNSAGS
jgi:hypothetical protein